jgi:hypothetical protein
MPNHLRLTCNDSYRAIGKKWHEIISITSRCSTIELSSQLYFWSLRTHLNLTHFHIFANFCWCSQMSKFLRCVSHKFFLLMQISNLQISTKYCTNLSLNSSEIRLCIHFIFTNLNWGILYYIFKRELTVSLDNVSTQAGKNVYI